MQPLLLAVLQPPKKMTTLDLDDVLAAIQIDDPSTREIGFTGGEPTLLGKDFLANFSSNERYLPDTPIHFFQWSEVCGSGNLRRRYADIRHFDMMVGIPDLLAIFDIHDTIGPIRRAL